MRVYFSKWVFIIYRHIVHDIISTTLTRCLSICCENANLASIKILVELHRDKSENMKFIHQEPLTTPSEVSHFLELIRRVSFRLPTGTHRIRDVGEKKNLIWSRTFFSRIFSALRSVLAMVYFAYFMILWSMCALSFSVCWVIDASKRKMYFLPRIRCESRKERFIGWEKYNRSNQKEKLEELSNEVACRCVMEGRMNHYLCVSHLTREEQRKQRFWDWIKSLPCNDDRMKIRDEEKESWIKLFSSHYQHVWPAGYRHLSAYQLPCELFISEE